MKDSLTTPWADVTEERGPRWTSWLDLLWPARYIHAQTGPL